MLNTTAKLLTVCMPYSGSCCPSGSYEYQFTNEGSNFYWSGCVDLACKITMRGTVNVQSHQSYAADLEVKVGQYEAEYDVSGMTGRRRRKRSKKDFLKAKLGILRA